MITVGRKQVNQNLLFCFSFLFSMIYMCVNSSGVTEATNVIVF